MKITLVTVGKIKERYFEDAIREYAKRLSRYCKLDIIQVADEKTPDGAGEAIERQIKEKEGQRILSNIQDGAYVIALALEQRGAGRQDSEAGSGWGRPYCVCHRWFAGIVRGCYEAGGLCPELF